MKIILFRALGTDFNLTPIIAEAYYQQVAQYFHEHANVTLSSGEIAYAAVAADEPAGKHIRLTRKVTTRLKLLDFNADLEALADYGLAGLRRHRLARLTRQAYDQEALLSYEDLAMLLTTSLPVRCTQTGPSTVRRDVYHLRHQGQFIMTRGTKKDMGPGLSHKTLIVDLYVKGYTFTDIERQTNHSETSVKRYLADFIQVATLYRQDFAPSQIRLIAQKSERLVREYIRLYETYQQQNNQRLMDLLTPKQPGSEAKKNPLLTRHQEVDAMSKPLTKAQIQLKKCRRLKDKGLGQMLLYRFLHHYGYDKGQGTAKAIIEDILTLIDQYFLVSTLDEDLHHIHYGQLVWMAVPVDEFPQRGKTIAATRMKPVVLSFLTNADIDHIAHGFDSVALRKKRLARWVPAWRQTGMKPSTRALY